MSYIWSFSFFGIRADFFFLSSKVIYRIFPVRHRFFHFSKINVFILKPFYYVLIFFFAESLRFRMCLGGLLIFLLTISRGRIFQGFIYRTNLTLELFFPKKKSKVGRPIYLGLGFFGRKSKLIYYCGTYINRWASWTVRFSSVTSPNHVEVWGSGVKGFRGRWCRWWPPFWLQTPGDR